ncbi:MAG: aldehyde ferredoxin oxidoreductase C-terminal domain-containing protein [Pseudomonadota bacterium]
MIATEVDPLCHPLSPDNKLVVAPGILGGTNCPCSGRTSFGGKSPLTWGIKESNVGGNLGSKLSRLGFAGIIIEGKAQEIVTLFIDKNGARLLPAKELADTLIYEATARLQDTYGKKVAVATIGPAGEALMAGACIGVTDVDGVPTRQAGRGGLGALMGSKNLKAIVVDDTDTSMVPAINKENFNEAVKTFTQLLKKHPLTSEVLPQLGTNGVVNIINEAGAYPTRNFSSGRFEKAADVCGEKMREIIVARGANPTHHCMAGCPIQCSNTYRNEKGEEITGGLEYESIWALGANCGIGNLDDLALLNRLCDDIGLDTIETGVAIGVAMEAGVLPFGDSQGAINLLQEIRKKSPIGRIIGNGARVVGEAYGVVRVPVVKGQGIPGYDPRAIKGMGVTYAISPMGADHTSAYSTAPEIYKVGGNFDPLSPEGKVKLVMELLTMTAAIDATGLCFMASIPFSDDPKGLECLLALLSAKTGKKVTVEDVVNLGKMILDTEWDFNKRAGLSSAHNRLPRFLRTEKLPPLNVVNDVDEKEMEALSL